MADHPKDSSKSKKASPPPTSQTDLQTPINLPELDTPRSTSLSRFLLRKFAPQLSTTNRPVGSKTASPPPMDPSRHPKSKVEPWTPFPNIHNKPEPEPARKSTTTRVIGMARAIDAAKKLHRVLGISEPEPFVTPPAMPEDLEQEFAAGLAEYGVDTRMPVMGLDVLSHVAGMQERLPEIVEESKSQIEVETAPAQSGQEKGLFGTLPVRSSDAQSTTSEGAKDLAGASHQDGEPSACAASAGMKGAGIEELMEESMQSLDNADQHTFASSPPQMTSQVSRPSTTALESNVGGTTLSDGPQSAYASYGPSSFAAFRKQMDKFEEQHMPAHAYASPRMSSDDILTSVPKQMYIRSATKPLFPSPHVGAQSRGQDEGASRQPMVPAPGTPAAASPPGNAFFDSLFHQPPAPSAPRITVQAPSPTKLPSSKKRLPPLAEDLFGPALKGSRQDEKKATGLPSRPATSSDSWETEFPGNTPALLTILLNWSFAMQSFYRRIPNPRAFRSHKVFPFPVTAPIYKHLISVGFYDTSVVPHKEIRFLGPGDAAEMGYAEVDVFRSNEEIAAFEKQEQECTKIQAMKQKLGLGVGFAEPKGKRGRSQDQMHLAMGGEGRWAYVLIKGRVTSPDEIAPHVMLAWHASTVTDASTCLHMVFPDQHNAAPNQPLPKLTSPKQSLKRFASLQNLVSANRGQRHLHREIRSVSSSSELPQVDLSSIVPQEGAQTFKRTVFKLEKAGSIPLIEGYRVDLGEFRGWLDAVGRGEGKVIIWREP